MKIIVLHGNHVTRSYARLTKFLDAAKERGWETINDEVSATPSLFGQEKLIIIRKLDLLTKGVIKNLNRFPGTLIIYHEDNLPAFFLKQLPAETKIEKFELPKIIWQFLDRLSVKLLHEVVENEPVEFVFAILAKRFRDLYWAKVSPETLPYQPWQIGKLKKQAAEYTTEQLKEIIKKLAVIDILAKTSKADLLSELDLLLIKYLE